MSKERQQSGRGIKKRLLGNPRPPLESKKGGKTAITSTNSTSLRLRRVPYNPELWDCQAGSEEGFLRYAVTMKWGADDRPGAGRTGRW
jgi:hypothetical protein